jgi:hypothetical protein
MILAHPFDCLTLTRQGARRVLESAWPVRPG